MNDYVILNNLFENKVDMIDFQNFEESNVIRLNNNKEKHMTTIHKLFLVN